MSDLRFVYITAPSAEVARDIGRIVVAERLAACANVIDGLASLYWWEGKVAEDREAALILKTRADRLPALTARVKALHPYTVPCVVALPIDEGQGNPDFLAWIRAEATGA
ncbi:MAG: divalent-cation tolerance protein CutA [Alphaproteobacteria bacterium]|nr:divalent-cation tolerance protein CutA [Alphaproteobacteria bacterium]